MEATTGEVEARRIPLWCSWCGKRHADEGEFATRPHRTHRCVNDVYGVGCGREWRLENVVFGDRDPSAVGSNEKYIEVLSEIFDAGQVWSPEASLAFGAAIRALRADDEFARVLEQLEEQRSKLLGQQKSSAAYAQAIQEIEALQRRALHFVRSMLRVDSSCLGQ